ncbi:MAG: 50S ribosomal protein L11 methyltransferase [Deltaproteobacteria bacterium]|nr:50S ribosomal protein L11 methyltransferase [Deltaproteobacteria bacterium]
MKPDKTLETLISKTNLDLALGKLYQENIFTLQQKNLRGKIFCHAELPPNINIKSLISRLRTQKDLKGKILFQALKIKTSKDRSWEKAYQKHLNPFVFLKKDVQPLLWIDPQEKKNRPIQENTLYLKAGLAFGTGGHPTTQLAAELLWKVISKERELLDMGCGSSLLAMTAAKLGVKNIWAIDNDPVALEVSQENCTLNGIKNIQFALSLSKTKGKKFDIVVANILLPVLIALKMDLAKHLKKNGQLIVSGLLYRDCAPLLKAYAPDWKLIERRNRKGWSALLLEEK